MHMIVSLFGIVQVQAFIHQPCHSERSEEFVLHVYYNLHAGIKPVADHRFLVA